MADGPTLADVGEFALIARIAEIIGETPVPRGDIGVGDDAAVIRLGRDPRVVATTDMLVEGRHFRLDWSSAYDIGRKAAAQNLADIEAMGARPVSLLIGLGAPGSTPLSWAEDFARGLVHEAAAAGAVVSGGDTVQSDLVTVSVTALGSLDGRLPILRLGAAPGDPVFAAGRLGWSAAGLALLERADAGLVTRHGALVDAHRVPCPPYGYGTAVSVAGATAMIDLSDGLLADLGHILEESGVGVDLDSVSWQDAALFAAAADLGAEGLGAAEWGANADRWVLAGGEDHALLFTMRPASPPPPHPLLRRIGTVSATAGLRVDGVLAAPAGFDHFLGTP